tara:strand:- start:328 stop:531 length:204 start_codon:yes stop_codon:yes gene_type:complete
MFTLDNLSIKELKLLLKYIGLQDTIQMFEQLGHLLEGNSYTDKEYDTCCTAISFIDKHKTKLEERYH